MTQVALVQWCRDHNVDVTISADPIYFGGYAITMTSLTHKLRTRQIISPELDIDWEMVLDGMYKNMEVPDERSSDAE